MADSKNDDTRSVSRGREFFHSSGRGGVGNIRHSSISSDRHDDSPATRGREPAVHPDRIQMFSVGRGGSGNIRSPSRDVVKDLPLNEHAAIQAEYEQQIMKHHAQSNPIHSSGRGGLGNISGSRSRSRGILAIHRGGAADTTMHEDESKMHAHHQARGGVVDLTNAFSPDVQHNDVVHPHGDLESSGPCNRRSRSTSCDPSSKHGISALWSKVSHPSSPSSGNPIPQKE